MSLTDKLPSVIRKLLPKGATEMCMNCRGSGIVVHREILTLKEVCSDCSGHGDVLWIDKMIDQKSKEKTDRKALEEAVLTNVRDLLREISIQYSKLNVAVDLNIQMVEGAIYPAPMPHESNVRISLNLISKEDYYKNVHSQKIIPRPYGP